MAGLPAEMELKVASHAKAAFDPGEYVLEMPMPSEPVLVIICGVVPMSG